MIEKIVNVSGIVIEDDKLLITSKNGAWILPGGELKDGESDPVCLVRSFREGFGGLNINPRNTMFYREFTDVSSGKGIKSYFVDIDGKVERTSGGITDFVWMKYLDSVAFNLSDTTRQVADSLHRDGYLNGLCSVRQ